MKLFFLFFILSTGAFAQNSSYSAADQNASTNTEGSSQMDTGYVNKDAENDELKSSDSMDNSASMPQNQEEPRGLTSGKNATLKKSKTPLDD